MRIEYLTYRCPTCARKANIPTAVSREPLRCTVCNVIICNSCGDFSFCPTCRTFIQQNEYRLIRNYHSNSKKSGCITGGSCCFILCFPMVLLGGIFMNDLKWMLVGGLGMLLGIIAFAINSNINKKKSSEFNDFRNKLIPLLKARRNNTGIPLQNSYQNAQNSPNVDIGRIQLNTNFDSSKICPSCKVMMNSENSFCNNCGYHF